MTDPDVNAWELTVEAYQKESDIKAHMCCSECEEAIQYIPKKGGAHCGCKEMPKEWTMKKLEIDNEN